MLWEIFDDIRSYIKMTFVPAMRNLFSSLRGFVGMLLVMLVLQLLLSVICIFGIENMKNQQIVIDNFENTVVATNDLVKDENGSYLTSNTAKAALSGAGVFIGALCIWGICALSVYAKVTFAAADRDKYIWGMYITHGAEKKKIRATLKCELYIPHLLATAAAYPLALWLLNRQMRPMGQEYSHSLLVLACILIISYICIRLVVAYQCFLIRSRSCTELLSEEDAPKSVCFPRRHSRLRLGFTPWRYASSTFIRMRRYYISLAAVAAIPAIIWSCFSVCVASQDSYLSSSVEEFKVVLSDGIDGKRLEKIAGTELSAIKGISGVSATAKYDASKIYTHVLADKNDFSSLSLSPFYTSSYADGTVTLCRNDEAFHRLIGGNALPAVPEGEVCIVSPQSGSPYALADGSRIYFAVSRTDGSVHVPNSMEDLNEKDYEYIELRVNSNLVLKHGVLTPEFFNNVDTTYFVLNDNDYLKLTGMDIKSLSDTVDSMSYSFAQQESDTVNLSLTVPKNEFTQGLAEGDIIKLSGIIKCKAVVEYKGTSVENERVNERFQYIYVNSASVSGDNVIITATPRATLVVRERSGLYQPVYLALGTPNVPSNEENFFASTYSNFALADIEITADTARPLVMYKHSNRTSGDCGTYAVLNGKQLGDTNGRILLQSLHADNNFELYFADRSTANSLMISVDEPKKGSAVLVLPKAGTHFAFSEGGKLRLAVTKENVAKYDDNSEVQGTSYDLLSEHLNANEYEYVTVYISQIIYSENVSRASVLLGHEDFSAVINKSAPYVTLNVSIDGGIENAQYATIREKLSSWALGNDISAEMSSTGNYLQYLLRKTSNYSTVISLIAFIIPLIIPFIWYYPLASFFDRRRTEVALLHTMGKRRRTVLACYLLEGVFLMITAFLSVLVLCAPCMLIFKLVCTLAKLPLEFEYSFISPLLLCFAAGVCAACAFIAFVVCALTTRKRKRRI